MVSRFTRTGRIVCGYIGTETIVGTHGIELIESSVDIVGLSGEVIGFGHGGDGFPGWWCGTGHSISGVIITTRLTVGDGSRTDGGVTPRPCLRSDGDIGFGTISVDYAPIVSTVLT